MLKVSRNSMKAWNGGLTVEEAVKRYGPEMIREFKEIESVYGCGSIPVPVLLGYKSKRNDK